MGIDRYTGDGLIGDAQAFDEVTTHPHKNQRQQGFAVVLAFVQAIIAGFVAPPVCPDQPSHKDQADGVEDGFVGPIKITHQDFTGIGPQQRDSEIFFDGDDISTDKQTEEAKKNQGMHHAWTPILHRLFLAQ